MLLPNKKILLYCIFSLLPAIALADTHTAANCELSTVQAVIDNAGTTTGDIVAVPAGSCTWGASATYLSVNKAVTVQGAGRGATNITLSDTGPTGTSAVIRLSAAATVSSMTITGSSAATVLAFSSSGANGWRVTDIEFVGGSVSAYFMFITGTYGLIDHNTITGNHGSAELIFARGPTDSWQTAHSMGGAGNLFIENNIFAGSGYVTNINSNGMAVVRYNTITGPMKIDGHGKETNTPARSVRHMEIYNNLWTSTTSGWSAIELRGGTGRIFNNHSNVQGSLQLRIYCAWYKYANYDNTCQGPTSYPVLDQVGRGYVTADQDLEPVYLWNNTIGAAQWDVTRRDDLTSNDAGGCLFLWGGADPAVNDYSSLIQSGRDFHQSETKPEAMSGYTPYTCPHPLAGAGSCDPGVAGIGGYSVNAAVLHKATISPGTNKLGPGTAFTWIPN